MFLKKSIGFLNLFQKIFEKIRTSNPQNTLFHALCAVLYNTRHPAYLYFQQEYHFLHRKFANCSCAFPSPLNLLCFSQFNTHAYERVCFGNVFKVISHSNRHTQPRVSSAMHIFFLSVKDCCHFVSKYSPRLCKRSVIHAPIFPSSPDPAATPSSYPRRESRRPPG